METIYNNPDTPVEEIKYGITTGSGQLLLHGQALLVLNDEDVDHHHQNPMGNLKLKLKKQRS